LIQRSNRETKRYFVGDVIEGGVSLTSVAVDQVILKREDASEVLRYPQGTYTAAFTPTADSPSSLPVAPAFPQSAAAIAQQALQNNSAAPASQNIPPPTGSRRMLKLRDRLRMPTPPADNSAPPAAVPPTEEQDAN